MLADRERTPLLVASTKLEKGLRAMTIKERLEVHRQIEAENRENIEGVAVWDRRTAAEVEAMIAEKDRLMEWDEHFVFLLQLLNRKRHHAVFGI